MGVYDRDYYRNDPPGGRLLGGVAPICQCLIAINVVVFILQMLTLDSADGGVTGWLLLSSDRVLRDWEVWRLVTYAFCHAKDPMHIIANMWFLWMVGAHVEPIYGPREFLRFYLTGALVSALGFMAFEQFIGRSGFLLGASGAVMGVAMLCAMYYPSMKILFMFIIPIEMRWLVPMYIAFDMLPVLQQLGGAEATDNVAHIAHLSGLAYGFLYKHFDLRYSRLAAGWSWTRLKRLIKATTTRRPNDVRIYEPPDERVPTPDLKHRVDEILEKISAQGESSLSDTERDILKEASRRYKNR